MFRADRATTGEQRSPTAVADVYKVALWAPLVAVLTVLLLSLTLIVQARALGAGWSSFVFAGQRMTVAGDLPDELVVTSQDLGYDGQYVYRLSRDPLTDRRVADGIRLDNPAYRQQRILLPAMAWALSRVTSVSTLIWLPVINVLAGALLAVAAVSLLRRYRAPLSLALLASLSAPVVIGTSRNLNEPLALALAVSALAALAGRRPWLAGLACVGAVLAKETTLVVPLAIGLAAVTQLVRGDRRPHVYSQAVAASVVGAVYLAWHRWLAHHWAVSDPQAAGDHLSWPLIAQVRSLFVWNVSEGRAPAAQEMFWLGGRWALALLLVVTALGLRKSLILNEAKVAWALGAMLAVSVPGWLWGAQFTRAGGEAIVLASLILATCPHRWRWACLLPGVLAFLTIQGG